MISSTLCKIQCQRTAMLHEAGLHIMWRPAFCQLIRKHAIIQIATWKRSLYSRFSHFHSILWEPWHFWRHRAFVEFAKPSANSKIGSLKVNPGDRNLHIDLSTCAINHRLWHLGDIIFPSFSVAVQTCCLRTCFVDSRFVNTQSIFPNYYIQYDLAARCLQENASFSPLVNWNRWASRHITLSQACIPLLRACHIRSVNRCISSCWEVVLENFPGSFVIMQ
jgi:hypothetical protein